MSNNVNYNRIAINTTAMYIKMILSLFVTFFTTRIILQNLGLESFGVYNLVAGAVSMLSFISGSMSNTIQRFLAFDLGTKDDEKLNKTFSFSLFLHIAAAIIIVVLLEILFSILFNFVFIIPEHCISSAKIAYQIVIFITAISVITTPYTACFNAHEDIAIMAIIDFLIVVMKLCAAFLLIVDFFDKLVFYVLLLLFIQIINFLIKFLYSKRHYNECCQKLTFSHNGSVVSEMGEFVGWNMLESFSWLAKGQGVSILMNTFYGTIVNAAYGIAGQIEGQLRFFSSTLLASFQPQIYKLSGANDNEQMISLTITATKAAFFMLLIIFCPFAFLVSDLLEIWLVEVPAYSERMSVILCFITLTNFLSSGINRAVLAKGDIKHYQLVSSLIILISIPIGYIIYAINDDVYLLLYIMVLVEYISVIWKFFMASKILEIKRIQLFNNILKPCLISMVLCVGLSYIMKNIIFDLLDGFYGDILMLICDIILCAGIIYLIGITQKERAFFNSKVKLIMNYKIV